MVKEDYRWLECAGNTMTWLCQYGYSQEICRQSDLGDEYASDVGV